MKHRYLGRDDIEIAVEQGHGLHRPSLLRIRARTQGGQIEVEVGGRVLMVARGVLL
jgi:trans-2,3-dihydro-3-hydroxyanthranilate isomerase